MNLDKGQTKPGNWREIRLLVVRLPISKLDKGIYASNIISHAVSGLIERFRTTIGWQRNILLK